MVRALSVKKLQMGKNGLSPEFIEQARKLFESTKTVRISLLKSATRDRKQAKEIADKIISSLGKNYRYTIIGFTLIVRKSKQPQKI